MDKYSVQLMKRAYRDIEDIYAYIAHVKLAPENAEGQTSRIKTAILGLEYYPQSHQDRLVGRYADKGYKQLIIDNYIAIFRIDEDKKIVYVVTVQYQGRNL
ncbi:MAG: type II toxin-antitoxin system RelE/ParE family toxin [Lachnospiraceae bacterium]|nr:type II toxin-antitoxin system RelE/ParE family toxin [Lachnospiraceae bacterium]